MLLEIKITFLAHRMTACLLTQQKLNECLTPAALQTFRPKHAPINAVMIIVHPSGSDQRNEVVPLKININCEMYDTRL